MRTMTWIELPITDEQMKRVEAAAAREGMTPEEWVSRSVLASLTLHESLGARWPEK